MANLKIQPLGMCCNTAGFPFVEDTVDTVTQYEMICRLTNKVNELTAVINDKLEEYVRIQIDKLFINAMYEAETETLILVLDMH